MSAPGWLVAEVAEGIQRLLVLRLDGAPPADAVEAVALAWADALLVRGSAWVEHLDAQRAREAFRRMAANVDRWPPPARIWEFMPARQQKKALPVPPVSDEARARVRAMLADIAQKLRSTP